METDERIEHLLAGNRRYRESSDAALRERTAVHGQHPRAIVVACSDARVIPEEIFDAVLGELFVIRVAGNVLDNHQLGSIEYAAAHLGCPLVIVLGHTRCGAVGAALHGESDGHEFAGHPEIEAVTVRGAVYDVLDGSVRFVD